MEIKRIITPEEKKCRHCHQEIHLEATVCHHCGHYQNMYYDILTPTTFISLLFLLLTGIQAFEAYQANENAQETLLEVKSTLNIADMAMRMRIGLRSGLIDLEYVALHSDNEVQRISANNLLQRISADYDSVHSRTIESNIPNDLSAIKQMMILQPTDSDSAAYARLIDIIQHNDDLNEVSFSFIVLRKFTKYPFKMFDIKSVTKWYENQYPK